MGGILTHGRGVGFFGFFQAQPFYDSVKKYMYVVCVGRSGYFAGDNNGILPQWHLALVKLLYARYLESGVI